VIAVRQIRFRALITLDPARMHPGTPLHRPTGAFRNHTRALAVRARSAREPTIIRIFPAEICWDDDGPLCPGDRAEVTVTVTGDEDPACFDAGCRFALWSGEDIGHGVVSRRVFTQHGPS
jgi:hypothetical protein